MTLAIPSLILKRLHNYGSPTNTEEGVVDRDTVSQQVRVEPKAVHYHANVSNVGTILSGANNNGAHSANGITALFMATGQDVANVCESSASIH